mgnify:FL=1
MDLIVGGCPAIWCWAGWGSRGRGGRGNVGVEADETEGIAALAVPFVHAAVDVVRSADFEFDGFRGAGVARVGVHYIAGTSGCWSGRCE